MQIGEPSMVWAIFISNILQNPKSPNLTFPSEKKILSGLRSRCIMLFLFSSLNASNNCRKTTSASSSFSIFFFCSNDSNVPPLQYSYTKQKLLGVLSVSINLTMLSFLRVDRMLISLIASCQSLGLALNDDFGMTLTAYQSFDFWWIARKTWPQTPLPMGYCRRQFQTNLLIQIQMQRGQFSISKGNKDGENGRVNMTAVGCLECEGFGNVQTSMSTLRYFE